MLANHIRRGYKSWADDVSWYKSWADNVSWYLLHVHTSRRCAARALRKPATDCFGHFLPAQHCSNEGRCVTVTR